MESIAEIVTAKGACRAKYSKWTAPAWYTRSNKVYASIPIDECNSARRIISEYNMALFKALPDGAICAGGHLAGMFDPTIKSNDIDLFFSRDEAFSATLDCILSSSSNINSPFYGYEIVRQGGLINVIDTVKDTHIINIDSKFDKLRPSIQLIKMFYFDDPSDVIDSFDMTMVQIAATNSHMYYNPLSFLDIKDKRIVFNRLHGPRKTLRRILKYSAKGYKLDDVGALEVLKDIQSSKGVEELDQETEYD